MIVLNGALESVVVSEEVVDPDVLIANQKVIGPQTVQNHVILATAMVVANIVVEDTDYD